jgi:tripartite ATP-independent transporter DctM subunit
MLIGVPFLIAVTGAIFNVFDISFLAAFPSRVFGILTNPVIISVPLFVLMGGLLERSDIAKKMMLTAGALFGNKRGGMAYAVIIVGALLAASTGVIAATVFMMGMIALPAMMKGNYSNRLSAGIICASGSLGQIIPPSILLILLTDQISTAYQSGRRAAGEWAADPVSVGDLFAGAMLPGMLLVGLYLLYIFIVSLLRPESCPPIKVSQIEGLGDTLTFKDICQALLAPLLLIVLVLGSILAGVATPTESAAIGAGGALILVSLNRQDISKWVRRSYVAVGISAVVLLLLHFMGAIQIRGEITPMLIIGGLAFIVLVFGFLVSVYQELRYGDLFNVAKTTATMVASIFMIVIGAFMLSLVFRGLGGDEIISEILLSLPGGPPTALFVVMVVVFFLGFILEYIEIIFIVVPIAGPPLMAAGIDPVWFAILLTINLQMAFLTPPFGYALFYLRAVAPSSLTTMDIYISIIPFVLIQLIALAIVVIFPEIATWLPGVIYK